MVATPCIRVALVRVASKLAGASVLDESDRQVFVVVKVIQDLVVRVTERAISRSLEGGRRSSLGPRWGICGSPTFGRHPWVPAEKKVTVGPGSTLVGPGSPYKRGQ
jgi:hypothetical protein